MPEKTNLADQIPEPPDRTRLLIIDGDRKPTAIWRDDTEASTDTACKPGEHWFDDYAEPMDWKEILKYARAVYAVASLPLASHDWTPPKPVTGAVLTSRMYGVDDYSVGDPVWIEDGSVGAPHAATVTAVDRSLLHAVRSQIEPRDHRVRFWAIPADQVTGQVRRREISED